MVTVTVTVDGYVTMPILLQQIENFNLVRKRVETCGEDQGSIGKAPECRAESKKKIRKKENSEL